MVEDIGIKVLIPIFVFSIIIVVGYLVSDMAFSDILRRKDRGEY